MDSDYYLSGLFENVTVQALTAGPVIALSLAFLLLFVSGFLSDTLYRWDMALDRPALPDAFFSAANPGLYLTAVLLALLLLVHFTIGDPEE